MTAILRVTADDDFNVKFEIIEVTKEGSRITVEEEIIAEVKMNSKQLGMLTRVTDMKAYIPAWLIPR